MSGPEKLPSWEVPMNVDNRKMFLCTREERVWLGMFSKSGTVIARGHTHCMK